MIHKEQKFGHIAGPFLTPPFPDLVVLTFAECVVTYKISYMSVMLIVTLFLV